MRGFFEHDKTLATNYVKHILCVSFKRIEIAFFAQHCTLVIKYSKDLYTVYTRISFAYHLAAHYH